jgi:Tfp pilus assembly protein PilF
MSYLNRQNSIGRFWGGQRGSSAYTFFGFVILIGVIVGTLAFFPWKQAFKGAEDDSLKKANAALAKKQWKEAADLFEKSLKANPNNSHARIGMARIYVQQNDLERAMKEADLALKSAPSNADALSQKAIVFKLKGDNDKAMENFQKAVNQAKSAWVHAHMADLYMRKQDLKKAEAEINKALNTDKNFVEALRLRAVLRTKLGKCKEASEDFGLAEQKQPNDAGALSDKAWFLLTCPDAALKNPGQAMELAQKAEAIDGKSPLVQETIAEAFFLNNQPQEAAKRLEIALEEQRKKCPDGSCVKEMEERLKKYKLAADPKRDDYEILPLFPSLPSR